MSHVVSGSPTSPTHDNSPKSGASDTSSEGSTLSTSSNVSEHRTLFEDAKRNRPHSPTVYLFESALRLWEREAERQEQRIKELLAEVEKLKRDREEAERRLVANISQPHGTFIGVSQEPTADPTALSVGPIPQTYHQPVVAPVVVRTEPAHVNAPRQQQYRFEYPNLEAQPQPIFTSPIECRCDKCEAQRAYLRYCNGETP